jgi:hypothetical protein
MKPQKSVRWCGAFLVLAPLFLTGCASSGGMPLRQLAQACQQPRDALIPDWPEAMEDFPEYSIRLLGVIREERELESVERECVEAL